VRGEYSEHYGYPKIIIGSPPRAWGIPVVKRFPQNSCRFTPTCVGNTNTLSLLRVVTAVHPHVRGEYITLNVERDDLAGSPPRAWGIRPRNAVWHSSCRFTPTCVGNTESGCEGRGRDAVHPHVRGEYFFACASVSFAPGSPPRAWGIR